MLFQVIDEERMDYIFFFLNNEAKLLCPVAEKRHFEQEGLC